MDKKIKLEMNENRDIVISVNEEEKNKIPKENRKIKAEQIFQLLDYSYGDSYSIVIINEKQVDIPVIQFFYELLEEIIHKLPKEDSVTDNVTYEKGVPF